MRTTTRLSIALAFALTLTTSPALAQGNLDPRSAPAPSMKSLQQIWDKISTLESTVDSQHSTITSLESTVSSQQQLLLQQSSQLDTQADILATISSDTGNLWEYIDTGIFEVVVDLAFLPNGLLVLLTFGSTGSATYYSVHIQDGSGWQTTQLVNQTTTPIGGYTLLIDSLGRVHFIFTILGDDDDGLYSRIRNTTGSWGTVGQVGPRIDSGNFYLSSATGSGNRVAYAFVGEEIDKIRIFWISGATFHNHIIEERADFSEPAVLGLTSVAFNPATGFPAVAYQATIGQPGAESKTVRYAEFDGTSWNPQRVGSDATNHENDDLYPSLAFNPLTSQPTLLFRSSVSDGLGSRNFYTLAIRTAPTVWLQERHNGFLPWQFPPQKRIGTDRDLRLRGWPSRIAFRADSTALFGITRRFDTEEEGVFDDMILAQRTPSGALDYSTAIDRARSSSIDFLTMAVSSDNRVAFAFTPSGRNIHLAIRRLPPTP